MSDFNKPLLVNRLFFISNIFLNNKIKAMFKYLMKINNYVENNLYIYIWWIYKIRPNFWFWYRFHNNKIKTQPKVVKIQSIFILQTIIRIFLLIHWEIWFDTIMNIYVTKEISVHFVYPILTSIITISFLQSHDWITI